MEGRDMSRSVFALVFMLLAVFAASPQAAHAVTDGVAEFYAGHKALEENDVDQAIQRFTAALKSKSLDQTQVAYVYHYRAVAFQKLDKHKQAIDDYSQALAVGSLPKRVQAAVYYNRAIGLDRQQDYAAAVRDYTSAIALKPDYAEAYMNRGNAHRKLGDNVQALKDYEASSKYGNPMKHLPYFGRGLVLEEMGNTQKAYDAFKIAASLAPADFIYANQKVADYDAGRIPETAMANSERPQPAAGVTAAIKKPEKEQRLKGEEAKPTQPEPPPAASTASRETLGIAEAKAKQAEPEVEPAKDPELVEKSKSAESPASAAMKEPEAESVATTAKAIPAIASKKPEPQKSAKIETTKPKKPAPQKSKVLKGFLVQVASYTSEAAALTEAAQMKRRNADVFSGIGEHIVKADLGAKGIYWRLQFGPFTTSGESASFCKKLKTRGLDCIVVKGKG